MTLQEFYTYQENSFDKLARIMIVREGINARKEMARREARETPISQLKQDTPGLTAEDSYDLEGMTFLVGTDKVTVNDVLLGRAIASLPPKRREVILLSYFLNQSDPQIGALLNLDSSTVNYRRKTALSLLKDIMEELDHG